MQLRKGTCLSCKHLLYHGAEYKPRVVTSSLHDNNAHKYASKRYGQCKCKNVNLVPECQLSDYYIVINLRYLWTWRLAAWHKDINISSSESKWRTFLRNFTIHVPNNTVKTQETVIFHCKTLQLTRCDDTKYVEVLRIYIILSAERQFVHLIYLNCRRGGTSR